MILFPNKVLGFEKLPKGRITYNRGDKIFIMSVNYHHIIIQNLLIIKICPIYRGVTDKNPKMKLIMLPNIVPINKLFIV